MEERIPRLVSARSIFSPSWNSSALVLGIDPPYAQPPSFQRAANLNGSAGALENQPARNQNAVQM
jgi:hypothetical protein